MRWPSAQYHLQHPDDVRLWVMPPLASELASGGAPLVDTRPTDDLGVAEGPAR
uniref:Uncharacterized protein n=1 Tax=Pseudomonas putida (strain ATCC 700007 / DSM 6899 / JCM 31910 / BCRC 17059 / LMG 24140 / F1) TaxID=351746 RepID=A5VZS0_PSEP1